MENGGGGGGGGIMSGGSVGQVPAPPSAAFSHISTAAGGVGGMGGGLLGDRSSFGSGASDASSSSSAASASAASSYPPPPPRGSTTTGGGYAPGALSTPRPGKGVGSSLPSYASTPAAGPYSAFPSRAASPLRPPTAGAATPSSHSYHHPAAAVVGGSAAEDGKQQGASLLELLYGSRVVLRGVREDVAKGGSHFFTGWMVLPLFVCPALENDVNPSHQPTRPTAARGDAHGPRARRQRPSLPPPSSSSCSQHAGGRCSDPVDAGECLCWRRRGGDGGDGRLPCLHRGAGAGGGEGEPGADELPTAGRQGMRVFAWVRACMHTRQDQCLAGLFSVLAAPTTQPTHTTTRAL